MGSEAAPSYMSGCPYHIRNTHGTIRIKTAVSRTFFENKPEFARLFGWPVVEYVKTEHRRQNNIEVKSKKAKSFINPIICINLRLSVVKSSLKKQSQSSRTEYCVLRSARMSLKKQSQYAGLRPEILSTKP
jgi:hypothetical protein